MKFIRLDKIIFLIIINITFAQADTSFKEIKINGFKVKNPQIVFKDKNSKIAAAYFEIENQNNFDDKLLSIDGDISKNIQIHNTIMQNGIMKMFEIDDGIELKKNSNFKFEQGKYHIMIMDIVNGVEKTNHYLNLNFERSKKIKINFETISFKQKLKSGH
ncbi:copper chaperone PCu(A)C [Candidatus Pelagibacter sp.]|uniref:copper chaperone PCu(A)C n=1 Tax=Candidatus Pelagibacter sp. TaxID=2024849 RepID=UPI003F854BD9